MPSPTTQSVTGPEIDDDLSGADSDSGIGTYATSSTSITSSLYTFVYENGRRYHAQRGGAQYNLPNDENELDRLDLQHHLFLLTFGGSLYRAPLNENVQSVLDIGTGTGIWAMDLAEEFPAARVTGWDLSPVQPSFVPPNCTFYIEDAEAPWSVDPGTYDYIHGRMIVVGIKNWANLLAQAFRALRPGGWFEVQDLCFPARADDESAPSGSPIHLWNRGMMGGASALGLDLTVAERLPQMMEQAGFVDVRTEWYTWPLGTWPRAKADKERGMWAAHNFFEGLQGFSMGFFTRGLGVGKSDVDGVVQQTKMQLRRRGTHVYLPIGVFCGMKPTG